MIPAIRTGSQRQLPGSQMWGKQLISSYLVLAAVVTADPLKRKASYP